MGAEPSTRSQYAEFYVFHVGRRGPTLQVFNRASLVAFR